MATPTIVHDDQPANRRSRRLNPELADTPILIKSIHPNWNRVPMVEDTESSATVKSLRVSMAYSHIISQEAVNLLTARSYAEDPTTWIPANFITSCPSSSTSNVNAHDIDIEHFCSPVIHPVTGESITNYKKLARDPLLRKTWTTGLGKEFGNLAQGEQRPQYGRRGIHVHRCQRFLFMHTT